MKKTLFLEELYAVILSLIITAILAFSVSGALGSLLKLPIKGGGVFADTAVIINDKIEYSTRELTVAEERSLIMAVKAPRAGFESAGVSYDVSVTAFEDGVNVAVLKPRLNTGRFYLGVGVGFLLIFLLCYTLAIWIIAARREQELIKPIKALEELTKRLSGGDFDINIPDEGADEIKGLALQIEALRIRLKDEIYRSRRAAEDRKFLISGISHDLRTPLTALTGYLEGILDGVADTPEAQREYVKKSIERVNLINRMINDLLEYSKLDSQQVEFKLQEVNAAEYLQALTEENRMLFEREEKSLVFDTQLEKEYNIYVDVHQLDRVMANILENALRYTKRGTGAVVCSLREAGGSVIIELFDNGEGIKESEVPKIFDRFYRGEKSRQVKGSSGLGLAISKRIIENMGGRIWAKSKLNEGTSIMISLKKYEDKNSYEKDIDN